MADYHFGSGSFKDELWLNDKAVFTKPKSVDVEFITPGSFDWVFADANGVEVRTLHQEKAGGGWTSIDFASLGLYDDYSIGFRNTSPGERQIKQGDVRM